MILSHKHKFIFIKGKKVAGTSMEVLLSHICGPEDIITPITPVDEQIRLTTSKYSAQNYGANEKELKEYKELLKNKSSHKLKGIKPPKGLFKNHISITNLQSKMHIVERDWRFLAIERCPYRKVISLANMRVKHDDYLKGSGIMSSSSKELKKQIQKMFSKDNIKQTRNINLYKNEQGRLLTKILRFEHLEEDLKLFLAELDIHSYPKMVHLKQGLNSNDLDPANIFTKDQINTINEIFDEEFTTFKYEKIK